MVMDDGDGGDDGDGWSMTLGAVVWWWVTMDDGERWLLLTDDGEVPFWEMDNEGDV